MTFGRSNAILDDHWWQELCHETLVAPAISRAIEIADKTAWPLPDL